jgi:Tfp pilus assembly protein FimT
MIRFFILPILLITLAGSPIMSVLAAQQNQNVPPKKLIRNKAKRTVKARSLRRTQARKDNQDARSASKVVSKGPIQANDRTHIYYWPTCPDFNKVPLKNRVIFGTSEEAEKAGYKAARNCPQ